MVEKQQYEVVITKRASLRFDLTVLTYLLKNFTLERALEIEKKLIETASKLKLSPNRGTLEQELDNFPKDFRFIIFKETRNLEIKNIYYVNENIKRVYITDFFPVKTNSISIKLRS